MQRVYRFPDTFLMSVQQCLHTLHAQAPHGERPNPSATITEDTLSHAQQRHSAGLMRVNHTGEVCAQALYLGQQWATRNHTLQTTFMQAAQEEADHLHWCQERLIELQSHTSYLNPLWFAGAWVIGLGAGCLGDAWSLGFLAQTEQQVSMHLSTHLEKLPDNDQKSRAIVAQMRIDETKHATTAMDLGGRELPIPVKIAMQWAAKMMTTMAYYV